MIAKLEDINFGVSGDIINVSGTVRLYADDGTTVLFERGISAKGNFNDPNLKSLLVGKLTAEMQAIVDRYKARMSLIQSFYPTATTPQEALGELQAEVENGVTV